MEGPYFLGIDVGTQGARAALLDVKGNLVSAQEEAFLLSDRSREEQSPDDWWNACMLSLKKLTREAAPLIDLQQVKAAAVTSTSGTVIPLDADHRPLHNAIMYSDQRSAE